MHARSVRADDLAAVTALQRSAETHWFGSPETDDDDLRQQLDLAVPLVERSRLLLDEDGALLAAAWWWSPGDSFLAVRPDLAPTARDAVHDDLLAWFTAAGVRSLEALSCDDPLQDALARHGWRQHHSSFELIRDVSPDWQLPVPRWPADVRVGGLRPPDEEAAHHLIYEEAGWASVPGHGVRDLAEWRHLFVTGVPAEQNVLAWRGDRLAGAALGKTFSDGSGWVAQLAVPHDLQGQGIGRNLLLEAFSRRVAEGAVRLGLGVSAANADALRLYLGIGLTIDREWRPFAPGDVLASLT
jgi:ribosomal protein S18 acetylase RimI-like enzyme